MAGVITIQEYSDLLILERKVHGSKRNLEVVSINESFASRLEKRRWKKGFRRLYKVLKQLNVHKLRITVSPWEIQFFVKFFAFCQKQNFFKGTDLAQFLVVQHYKLFNKFILQEFTIDLQFFSLRIFTAITNIPAAMGYTATPDFALGSVPYFIGLEVRISVVLGNFASIVKFIPLVQRAKELHIKLNKGREVLGIELTRGFFLLHNFGVQYEYSGTNFRYLRETNIFSLADWKIILQHQVYKEIQEFRVLINQILGHRHPSASLDDNVMLHNFLAYYKSLILDIN